jgi:hypothetical protein
MHYGRHDSTTTLIAYVEPLEAQIAFIEKHHIVINKKCLKAFEIHESLLLFSMWIHLATLWCQL